MTSARSPLHRAAAGRLAVGDPLGALNRVDPESGEILHTLTCPEVGTGVAWDGEFVWNTSFESRMLLKLDPQSGEVLQRIPLPGEGFFTGLAYDGEFLWLGEYEQPGALHKIDPRSGEVVHTIRSDRYVTGISWFGDDLWHATSAVQDMSTGKTSELRRVDSESGAVLERLSVPTNVSGLSALGDQFFCGDCTSNHVRIVPRPAQ